MKLLSTGVYLPIPLPEHLAGRPTRAKSSRIGRNLELAKAKPPVCYSLREQPGSINEIMPAVWNAELHHRSAGDSMAVLMQIPQDVQAALAAIGFHLPPGTEVELPSYLRWVDEAGERPCLGYVLLPSEFPKEMRADAPDRPRILVAMHEGNEAEAKDTLQLACDMAYYLAKARILNDPGYRRFRNVHLIAQIYALSVQHQFGAELIKRGFLIAERNGTELIGATKKHGLVQKWFDKNRIRWGQIDNVLRQDESVRAEIEQGLTITGMITAAQIIDEPIIVTPSLLAA